MIWIVAIAAGALVASGIHLALSRDAIRLIVGLSLLGTGANLVVLASGRLGSRTPAFVADGATTLAAEAANPLPQALVLTAVVIGLCLMSVALALVLALHQRVRHLDLSRLRAAEPPDGPDGAPGVIHDER